MKVREWTHFRVRLRPDLHEQIKADATANYRTINSELTMILEKHFAETQKETNEAQPASTPSSVSAQ